MIQTPLSNIWPTALSELHAPSMLWQIGTVACCMLLGWLLARLLRGKLIANGSKLRVMRLDVESFSRALSPLLALVLIAVAKPILAQWYPVDVLRIAIPLVGSFALIRLMFYVLHKAFARGGKAGSFLLLFEKLFATLVWIGVALYIVGWWPGMVQYLDETVIPVGRHPASLLTIVQAAVSVGVTLIMALWIGAVLEERLMKLDTMHSSLRAVMARMGRATLILAAVLVSLSLVGIDLTVLSVFGGALGVGIGLGLQKLVSSYVSGFVILLERSLTIGDMVSVDRYSGRVTQINTRYTVLRAGDGIEAVIPNEMLVSGPIQNFSLTDRLTRLATQVTVGYETDVDMVLTMLEKVTGTISRVVKDPPPQAFLLKFGADGLDLEVGFWITDPENGRLGVLSDVNRAIWHALQTHQINIPYPQRELRIIEGKNSVTDKMVANA
jgi:small-conductance mechanosensitive channel